MQLGPGRFQMMQQQVCDDCPNVKCVFYFIARYLLTLTLTRSFVWAPRLFRIIPFTHLLTVL